MEESSKRNQRTLACYKSPKEVPKLQQFDFHPKEHLISRIGKLQRELKANLSVEEEEDGKSSVRPTIDGEKLLKANLSVEMRKMRI
ncbi:hypothetical protein E3N88_13690 [Mikania micrantha]|uniref:Uncharacterized protein n=1 Tax=Mikania micrantha TaxID=192012 RepID=A0A5N6NZ71_9ASTR|nr:hypothetical protein E3N88_13690 [Mikania micrantha]